MFDYPAHAICLLYDGRIIIPDIIFNVGIAVAYFAIALGLRIVTRRTTMILPFRTMITMFALFILACGVSHLTRIGTVLFGGWFYIFDLVTCGLTFFASIATAVLLLKNGRKLLKLTREIIEVSSQ